MGHRVPHSLRAFAEERMSEAIANPNWLRDKFKEITDFGVTNEAAMDAEANAHFGLC